MLGKGADPSEVGFVVMQQVLNCEGVASQGRERSLC
jgi:hypothetical protein